MAQSRRIEPAELHVEHHEGDPNAPLLLLLHGLGGTGAVWDRMLAVANWPGDIMTPDLRGHGASPWTSHYSVGSMAADVAGLLGQGRATVVVGHSMGGAVALGLASGWFGIDVQAVVSIGIKVHWSDDDLAAIPRITGKPSRFFDNRAGAAEWACKLAGLFGIVDPEDSVLDRAVRPLNNGWIASLDPKAGLVGPPPLQALHKALPPIPLLHTLGENDPMVDPETAAEAGAPVVVFEGAGHNAMVEQPEAVWRAVTGLLS